MTMRQKLLLMEEAEKRNRERIRSHIERQNRRQVLRPESETDNDTMRQPA